MYLFTLCLVSFLYVYVFFFSSRRRHTRCALVTGVQTCALPISCEFGQAVDMPIGFWMQDENFTFFAGGLEVCSAFPARRRRGPLSLIAGRSRLAMLQPPRRAR